MAGKGQITRTSSGSYGKHRTRVLVPIIMLHKGRGHPREHHKGTSDHAYAHPIHPHRMSFCHGDVASGQKAPLGWILLNFRMHMRTPKETPNGSRDIRSLLVAMVFVLLP